jgi:hypothetical protein
MNLKYLSGLCVLVLMVGSIQGATIFADPFNGSSVDTTLWSKSGTVITFSGVLRASNGGYIRSNSTTSVQAGTMEATFKNVGTDDWQTNNMTMGLYNADHSQYVEFYQKDYGDYTLLRIKGPAGEATYFMEAGFWGMLGPELRDPTCNQTWRIVLSDTLLEVYVNDVLQVSLTEGQNLGAILGWAHNGTLSIPTDSLAVEFRGNAFLDFKTEEISLASVYIPKTAAPAFSPAGPEIIGDTSVTISSATASASIYYTIDGSEPTTSGMAYSNPTTVIVGNGTTLRAIAVGIDTSVQTSQTYNYATASAPTITPGGKYISGPTMVKVVSSMPGANVYYTTDGTAPTTSGTAHVSPATVAVTGGTILRAIVGAAGYNVSPEASLTFEVPAAYRNPAEIPFGSANVDGDLSDWAGAAWATLNVISIEDSTYTTADVQQDVPEAYYTARWQANKIYMAVKVRDTGHFFTDTYTTWNGRDAIEVFLHTDNNGNVNYVPYSTTAQQYEVGLKIDGLSTWAAVGSNGSHDLSTTPDVAVMAGKVVGQWIYYEMAMIPYTYLGLLETGDMSTTVGSQLTAGQVIGLDVDIISNNITGAFLGKKSENDLTPKYCNWEKFGLHKLIARLAGDANGDGAVDVGDLGILAANYGGTDKTWAQGDFNNDGAVDVGDLGILAANYGSSNFSSDYAKAFGTTVAEEDDVTGSSICNGLGLPIIAGLMLMGLMLVKLEEQEVCSYCIAEINRSAMPSETM